MALLFIALSVIALLILILIIVFIDEQKRRRERTIIATMDRYWDGDDRRKFIRIDASFRVSYKLEADAKKEVNATVTSDISEGGAGVILTEKFNEGSMLSLEIMLPNEPRPVSVKGRVTWIKEAHTDEAGRKNFDAGIEFLNIQKADKELLAKYIKDAGKIQR